MEEKILKTIKKYNLIKDGDKIVVGVSGGPDSITLLDLLLKLKNQNIIKFDIVVCHINHMIREEATSDEGYVKEYISQVLLKLDPKKVFEDLKNIYPGVDENEITLLCYESSKNGTENVFCHRNLVASWFRNNGIACEELHLTRI